MIPNKIFCAPGGNVQSDSSSNSEHLFLKEQEQRAESKEQGEKINSKEQEQPTAHFFPLFLSPCSLLFSLAPCSLLFAPAP